MALCDKCEFYRKEYDEFRQTYDDVDIIGHKPPENHFCPMYDDNIPTRLWYSGDECPLFSPKA